MPVPSTQEILRPLLEIFKDETPHNLVMNDLLELIADKLKAELDNSTEKMVFKNNVTEAIEYLKKKELLTQPAKATYMITRTGVEFLDSLPEEQEQEPNSGEDIEDDIPVGFDEPEVTSLENPKKEELVENEAAPDEDGEINVPVEEPEPDESENVSIINNEIEAVETQTAENTAEIPPDLDENDDGIDLEDPDDFDDFNENEVENVERIEAEENEFENENEIAPELETELETETKDEDLDEMNNTTELDTAANTVNEENPQEFDTAPNLESPKQAAPQNSSENLSLDEMFTQYNENLAESLLERVENLHPNNFCMLVMDLLSKMDYRVFQTARYTNDVEGTDLIQGIIIENRPGMNPIYIHARKLSSSSKTISKANMLDFVNALADRGGKGMFVTTGKFSESAQEAARDEGIILVDGIQLASLMIQYNFCVNTERTFYLKTIDSETFDEYDS